MDIQTKNRKGFTLIELLVVIAIIGTLASVVMINLSSARAKARDTKRVADINQVAKLMELYYNDKNNYPSATAGNLNATLSLTLEPKYLGGLPDAPTPADGSCTDTQGKGNNNYWFEGIDGTTYTVTFCLGNNGPVAYPSGTHTLTPAGIR